MLRAAARCILPFLSSPAYLYRFEVTVLRLDDLAGHFEAERQPDTALCFIVRCTGSRWVQPHQHDLATSELTLDTDEQRKVYAQFILSFRLPIWRYVGSGPFFALGDSFPLLEAIVTSDALGEACSASSDESVPDDPIEASIAAALSFRMEGSAISGSTSEFPVWHGRQRFVCPIHISSSGRVEFQAALPTWQNSPPSAWVIFEASEGERLVMALRDIPRALLAQKFDKRPGLQLRWRRIESALEFPKRFTPWLTCHHVEFVEGIDLNDVVVSSSLELNYCRIMRVFRAADATFEGSLTLRGSTVEGNGIDNQAEQQGPIRLDGVHVKRSLELSNLTVHGHLSLQSARVNGPLIAQGMRICSKGDELPDDGRAKGLRLSYAVIDGPLNLSCTVKTPVALGTRWVPAKSARRTRIEGSVQAEGLTAREVHLQGIIVKKFVDLSASRTSSINAELIPVADVKQRPSSGLPSWPTTVEGDVFFSNAQTGLLRVDGAQFRGRVSLLGALLGGAFAARARRAFRTSFNRGLDLSGAIIKSSVDLSGAKLAGTLRYVAGNCGSLRASVHRMPDGNMAPTQAQGIFLDSLQIDASVLLGGLQLQRAERPLELRNVKVGGALSFHPSDADFQEEERLQAVPASINGSISLVGLEVGGDLTLCPLRVLGDITLKHVHLHGGLRTTESRGEAAECETETFKAFDTRVTGSADFRGLRCRSNSTDDYLVDAPGLDVGGRIIFGMLCEYRGLAVNLERARADLLEFQVKFFASEASVRGRGEFSSHLMPFKLRLARVRQLSPILDSKDSRACMDLVGIEVGDWEIRPEHVCDFLARSYPLDARNYVDFETRLANNGQRSTANEVYRALRERLAHETPSWRKSTRNLAARWFSGHGTRLLRPILWLGFSVLLVTGILLAHPANL